jgi:hypothetical protein
MRRAFFGSTPTATLTPIVLNDHCPDRGMNRSGRSVIDVVGRFGGLDADILHLTV